MVTCTRCFHRSYWWKPRCWFCGVMLYKNKMPEFPTERVDTVLNGVKRS